MSLRVSPSSHCYCCHGNLIKKPTCAGPKSPLLVTSPPGSAGPTHTHTHTLCSRFVKPLIQLEIIFTLGWRYKMHWITKQATNWWRCKEGRSPGTKWPLSFFSFFLSFVYNQTGRVEGYIRPPRILQTTEPSRHSPRLWVKLQLICTRVRLSLTARQTRGLKHLRQNQNSKAKTKTRQKAGERS